ncbi:hypothetical protein D3C81_1859100 [compost metagenome]
MRFGIVASQGFKEASPHVVEQIGRPSDALFGKHDRQQTAFCCSAGMQLFGLRAIVDERPQSAAETASDAQCAERLRLIQPEDPRASRCGTKNAAGGRGVPTGTIVCGVAPAGLEYTSADFIADDHGHQ